MKRSPFRRARSGSPKKLGWLTLALAVSYILAGTFFPKETIQMFEILKSMPIQQV
jgi:hypothetical protein